MENCYKCLDEINKELGFIRVRTDKYYTEMEPIHIDHYYHTWCYVKGDD